MILPSGMGHYRFLTGFLLFFFTVFFYWVSREPDETTDGQGRTAGFWPAKSPRQITADAGAHLDESNR